MKDSNLIRPYLFQIIEANGSQSQEVWYTILITKIKIKGMPIVN